MIYQQELTEHSNASMRCGAELTGSTTEQESDSIGNHTIVSGISEGRRIEAMMNAMEYESFVDVVKAFSDEQKQIAIRNMPDQMLWDELYFRYEESKRSLNSVKDALSNSPQDTTHP